MKKPTFQELFEDGFLSVHIDSENDRYGVYNSEVFHRKSDDTYWVLKHTAHANGVGFILCEEKSEIFRVYPKEKTIIIYSP